MNQYPENIDSDYQQNITFNEMKSDYVLANYNQTTNQNSEEDIQRRIKH